MSSLSFRTRLLLSYGLLILVASAIVYGVALVQIRQQTRINFDQDLIEAADQTAEEVENVLAFSYEEWLCGEIDGLTNDQQIQIGEVVRAEFDGENLSCRELPLSTCELIAEELDLNLFFENDAGDDDAEFFCDGRFAAFEADVVERELRLVLEDLVTDGADHALLFHFDDSQLVSRVGEGPWIDEGIPNEFEDVEELIERSILVICMMSKMSLEM